MARELKWILAGLAFLAGVSAFGQGAMERRLKEEILVKPGGSATLVREERIPASPLQELYEKHAEALDRDSAVRQNFVKEVSKGYALVYGVQPSLAVSGQEMHAGLFTREAKASLSALAKPDPKDKSVRELKVKQFADEKKMLQYFEYVLDDAFLESAMVSSVKGATSITSEVETVYLLPEGSVIENAKDLDGKNWKVDFGGGSTLNASLEVDEPGARLMLKQRAVITDGTPSRLLADENADLFEKLRDYAGFVVRYREPSEQASAEPEAKSGAPVDYGLDYSGSWNYSVNESFSHPFTYQVLTVTPTVNIGFGFGASLTWEHHWKKVSWWKWEWRLKKFQTGITLSPSVGCSVTLQSGGQQSQQFSKDVITKGTNLTFWVSFVPVMIRLEANLKLKAKGTIASAIRVTTGGTLTINTSLNTKYEDGWSHWFTKSVTPSFNGYSASANITATVKGEAPFRVSAFVYYVAGPFAELVPWIQADSGADVSAVTNVHFKLHGALDVNGGAAMAGWLKSVVGNIGEYNKTFYSHPFTIYEGNVAITP
jgi:hypothetical protein